MAVVRGRIRGVALKPFVNWYTRTHGDARLVQALAVLADEERQRFNPMAPGLGISPAAWYPSATVHKMLDNLLDGLDARARASLASEAAEHIMAEALTGLVGTAVRAVVSPDLCALLGPRLWRAFYGDGRVRITACGRRCHAMEVSGWIGHHAFLCEMNNAAGRSIYRAAGGTAVSTERANCVAQGDRACVYVIRW
jgi:hypothetical protein